MGILLGATAHAANVSSTWLGGSGNWSAAGNWTNVPFTVNYPNNGNGGFTYDAVINSSSITLDRSITIQKLTLSGGDLGGSSNLTCNDLITWIGGGMAGTGTTVATGGVLINPGGGSVTLYRTLCIAGTSALTNGYVDTWGVLTNQTGAIFDIQDDSSFLDGGPDHGAFVNVGTLRKSGAGNNISGQGVGVSAFDDFVRLENSGTVQIDVGTLKLICYTQTAGITKLSGGAIASSNPLTIEGGCFAGTGTVSATVMNNGTISPGFPTGRLDINGSVTLQAGSHLAIELGGYTQGPGYDFVNVNGKVALGGELRVSFTNNFEGVATNGASFTVLTASTPFSGSFANVTNGGTLFTIEGLARVTVQYSGSSVVLSDLQMIAVVDDGIPVWWRSAFFGGNGQTTNSQSCAICDPDGDGRNNLHEYLSGTDPTNSTSAFRITEIIPEDEDVLITWTTVEGKWYVLQTTTDSNANYGDDFVDLNPAIVGRNPGESIISVVHLGGATNASARFYRVRILP